MNLERGLLLDREVTATYLGRGAGLLCTFGDKQISFCYCICAVHAGQVPTLAVYTTSKPSLQESSDRRLFRGRIDVSAAWL